MAFIKICGMTDAQGVAAALAQRVDAIGFVFAPSVRQVAPEQAVQLAQAARGKTLCVAVTLHPTPELVKSVLRDFRPDVLQTDADDLAMLHLPRTLVTWPVLRGTTLGAHLRHQAGKQRLLFEGPRSGTGTVADWKAARELAGRSELILAGGLSAANVADAIATVRPFGVDVSSGVESAPGRKDPLQIESFVAAARAAFARASRGDQ